MCIEYVQDRCVQPEVTPPGVGLGVGVAVAGAVAVGVGVGVGEGGGQLAQVEPQISTSVRLLNMFAVDPWPT